jgi:hypothetical protein
VITVRLPRHCRCISAIRDWNLARSMKPVQWRSTIDVGTPAAYIEDALPTPFFAGTQTGQLPERDRLLLAMAKMDADTYGQVERIAKKDVPLRRSTARSLAARRC